MLIRLTILNYQERHPMPQDLPALPISFLEYIRTFTMYESQHAGEGLISDIITGYKSFFDNLPANHQLIAVEPGTTFSDQILTEYRKSLSNVNLNYMVGTTFNESVITVWFNNQAYHTAPLTINLINNAILKYVI